MCPASGLIFDDNTPKSANLPRQSSVMARKAHLKHPSPTGLLKLPNEILLEIASLLGIADLRRLSILNRKLYFFVKDYLVRYRHNSRLVTLPNELILEIVQCLGSQEDQSCFARASQRFYLLVMDSILRHNVRYNGSSLLNYAAMRNLKRMARTILHLGGDVNTQRGFQSGLMSRRPTPLATAAFHGHERIVRILLETGASHFVDGMRVPLAAAICKRHENVALILSQDLDPGDMLLKKKRGTVLQFACEAKLVNLVRYYLNRGSRRGGRVNLHSLHDRSAALYQILRKDVSKDEFLKRELHEDVYQIVLMLLQHGADPDIRIKIPFSPPVTARAIASAHPDPRLRNLLLKATPATESNGPRLLIGRPWMSSENETLPFHEPQPETLPYEKSCYARLWDLLERSSAESPSLMDEDGTEYGEIDYKDYTLTALDTDLVEGRLRRLHKMLEPMEPPPLSSFPQLGIAKADAQHTSKTFWSEIPSEVSSGVDATQAPRVSGMGAISRTVKQLKKLEEAEQFPQLGRQGPAFRDTGKDLWANFRKDRVSQSTSETQRASPREGIDMGLSGHKPLKKKKKKWERLLI
jgi:hypothetical protein